MKLLGLEIRRVRELKRRGPRGIINQAAVLRFAHECGKRPTPDFIEWLEEQVKDQIDPRRRAARMMELAKRRTQLVLDGNIVTGATDEAPPQEQPGAADCSRDTPTAEGPAGPVDQGRGCPG